MIGTLAVTNALRSAIGRTADEIGQARALRLVAPRPAERIGTARAWLARRGDYWCWS